MLEFIRNRAQSWVAWVIVGLIIVPFALWGVGDYVSGGADSSVAVVNSTKISEREFQQAYFQQQQRMKEMFGDDVDLAVFDDQIRQNVIDSLIDQELLIQYANQHGLRVSPQQLATVIQSIDAFKTDGNFDRAAYESALNMQGQSPGYFESRVMRSLLTQQLYLGVAESSIITTHTVDTILKLQMQQREVGYFEIPQARYASEVELEESAIQDYYHDNPTSFSSEEHIDAEFVVLSASDLAHDIKIDDDELKELYESQKSGMATAEERNARHILIEIPFEASDEEKVKAEASANEVHAKLQSGEDFAELAKLYSDDPGSAELGGELGFFGRGDMVPEFDAKVFNMAEGEVSGLVETEFGFHIIQLDAIKASEVPSFAEIEEELRDQLLQSKSDTIYYDMADQLTNLSFEYPDSLEVVADELGLPIQAQQKVTRGGGQGYLSSSKVSTSLFADEVLNDRLNSEPIEIADNTLVVVRVAEHTPAEVVPLDEVRDRIVQLLTKQVAEDMAQDAGEAILLALQAGDSAEAIAKEHDVAWYNPEVISRNGSSINPTIVKRAFELPRVVAEVPSLGTVRLDNGNYAVVSVFSVLVPELDDVSVDERVAMTTQLGGMLGESEFSAITASMRDSGDIVSRLAD